MFIVSTSPQFTHTVEVLVPIDGGHEKQSFKATFRVMPATEDEESRHDLNTTVGSTTFLREAVVSMSELENAEGEQLEYSDKVRDQLLAVPYVRTALARAYFAAITKAAVGN